MDLGPLESLEGMAAPPCYFSLIKKVAHGSISPNIATLPFRDPKLHLHLKDWEEIIKRAPNEEAFVEVVEWLRNNVSIFPFRHHFKGSFQGHQFDSARPPPMVFKNNKSCEKFSKFIDNTILDRVADGAISVVGKVG